GHAEVHLAAELLRTPRRHFDVVDADVSEPMRRNFGIGILHHAAAGPLADVYHRVGAAFRHRYILELPAEQRRIEFFRGGDVAGVQLDVDKWIGHHVLLRIEMCDVRIAGPCRARDANVTTMHGPRSRRFASWLRAQSSPQEGRPPKKSASA